MSSLLSRRAWPVGLLLTLLLLGLGGCALNQNQGLQGDPAVARAHYNRAMAFGHSHNLERASQELELAVKDDPNMYFAYYQLGLVYEAMGRRDLAREAWDKGLLVARKGPDRADYPRAQAVAEMESAIARLEPEPLPPLPMAQALRIPVAPPAYEPPPKPKFRTSKVSASKSHGGKSHGYAVLLSSNQKKSSAQADLTRIKGKGYSAKLTAHKDKKGKVWHRVVVGCCTTKVKAQALAHALKKKGLAKSPQVVKQ